MKQIPTVIAVLGLLAGGPALAESFTSTPVYKECAALAASDPKAALTKAEEWLRMDDSVGGHHCQAMALYGLKQYEASAQSLALVRDRLEVSDVMLRSYVTRQASRAWVHANRADAAVMILSAQIKEMNRRSGDNATQARLTAEMLLDRANINQQFGKNAEAVQDLDHAVSLRPGNDDVLLARARVFIALGDRALAKEDLQAILRANPTHKDAVELMRDLRDVKEPVPTGEPPAQLPN